MKILCIVCNSKIGCDAINDKLTFYLKNLLTAQYIVQKVNTMMMMMMIVLKRQFCYVMYFDIAYLQDFECIAYSCWHKMTEMSSKVQL